MTTDYMSDDLRNRVARAIDPKAFEVHDTCLNVWEPRKEFAFKAADAALTEMGGVQVRPGQLERIIWSAMAWARENPCPDEVPEYTDRGNSFAETECRSTVARILAAIEPAPVSAREAARVLLDAAERDHTDFKESEGAMGEMYPDWDDLTSEIKVMHAKYILSRAIAEGNDDE